MDKVLFSSDKMDWETPPKLFDKLNQEFHFTLDPCATVETTKCETYFTKEQDGLVQSWEGETVFCNPPYGREIGKWVKKCSEEGNKAGTTVVMFIPSRTCTKWFHEYIYKKAIIRFIKGRLRFGDAKENAPFPSMIVIFGYNIFVPRPGLLFLHDEIPTP